MVQQVDSGGGSSTLVVEPPARSQRILNGDGTDDITDSMHDEQRDGSISPTLEDGSGSQTPDSLLNESEALPQWNHPSINVWRFMATNYSFIILGLNDASYGVSFSIKPLNTLFFLLGLPMRNRDVSSIRK